MTFSLLWATETELSVYHNRITELQLNFHESLENNQKLLQSVEEPHSQWRIIVSRFVI